MKFIYHGEYPAQGFIQQYGATFRPGEYAEVTDETGIRKLLAHPFFSIEPEEAVPIEPAEPARRRGRPPRVTNAQN